MTCRAFVLISALCVSVLPLVAQQTSAPATYMLKATPKTVAWGYYGAKAAPVLRVKSGDTVEIQTPTALTATPDEKQRIIYVKHLEFRGYPPMARQTRVQGTVIMKLKIGTDGRVLTVESNSGGAQKSIFPLLKDDAEKVVKTWTFGCVGCPPDVPFEHTIRFNYRQEDRLPENPVVMNMPDEVTFFSTALELMTSGASKDSKKGSH
jgi:outer membrane biosynthesis protein TonB